MHPKISALTAACILGAARLAAQSLGGAALLLSLAQGSTAASSQGQAVQITAAWIRWLPGGLPLAGYATLANVSDQPAVLTSATSDAFRDLSLHQTQQSGGTVRMSPLERISIAPHSTLDFQARGIHLMLMQPRQALDPRGAVPITLHFADGSSLTAPFEVRTAPDASPHG